MAEDLPSRKDTDEKNENGSERQDEREMKQRRASPPPLGKKHLLGGHRKATTPQERCRSDPQNVLITPPQ